MFRLGTDLRMAWRATMARPWFSGSLALVIALRVGLNTAAFSAVDSILVRPLPFHDPEQLVVDSAASRLTVAPPESPIHVAQ